MGHSPGAQTSHTDPPAIRHLVNVTASIGASLLD
uniref:Uncharacterized protein n=1 Tax=Arundo donax TaxID=35708 RepID=A0A0A9H289_ARUDO